MYDFLVLGGGSAGYSAARTAAGYGLKTAVLDGSEELGGLCILRGCMPSKAIIASANRFLALRGAGEFGLRAQGLEVRGDEVVARKRRLIEDFASFRREQLLEGDFELIRGHGRFLAPHRVAARMPDGSERVLEAKTIFISTGSKIKVPAIPGLEEAGYLVSDDLLDLADLPKTMAVLGGGAVAVEMAHYLEGLGVRIALIQRSSHILKEMDPDVSDAVTEAFRARGMEVFCGTHLERIERDAEGKRIIFEQDGETRSVLVDEIFAGLGRAPALDGIGLEEAGVERQNGLIRTDTGQRTSQPHIFAGGDVSGPLEVVHLAVEQGETAAHNAACQLGRIEAGPRAMDYRLKLFGVFCEPQAALVGMNEEELRAAGREYRTASYPFDDHGKSMILGETWGFVKLLADAESGEILGGTVVGPQAVDLIHEIVVAMSFRATVRQLAGIPHYHPSLSEIWTYPAEELAEMLL